MTIGGSERRPNHVHATAACDSEHVHVSLTGNHLLLGSGMVVWWVGPAVCFDVFYSCCRVGGELGDCVH